MNIYIFLQLSRKTPPVLEGTKRAETVEDAIRQMNLFPYDPRDFAESRAEQQLPEATQEEMEQEVFAYYGLIEGEDPWDYGNGPDGYGTVIVEIRDDDDTTTKSYPPQYPNSKLTDLYAQRGEQS